MDEMAEKLGLDPVEFRILNDTQVDPEKPGRPFSQRHLVECLRTGADRFGWARRNARPGTVRDGRWLVGIGVAAAFRNNLLTKSAARVRLDASGMVTVETDMTDIGTGSYTIIAQTAAEMMGVPLDKVVVRLGDSAFPVSSRLRRAVGRATTPPSGVYAACMKLREAVAQKLGHQPRPTPSFADGMVRAGGTSMPLAEAAGAERPRGRGRHRVRRPRQEVPAIDLRRAFRRGRRRRGHRRDPRAPHAGRVRGRPHPQPEDGAQPGDRRHDHGRRRGADGGARGRQAARLLRQPRPRRLRGAGARRHAASGRRSSSTSPIRSRRR